LLTLLLTRPAKDSPHHADPKGQQARGAAERFYRVEVTYNLFGEYSVMREWGPVGCAGRRLLVWFSNLREACMAADRWRKRAARRGYLSEGQIE
jgi:predicted DNA-binding WGR domain protein